MQGILSNTNNLLGTHQEMRVIMTISQKKQTKKKKKLVILQSIGIIVIKSKETRVVTYTCRYSSGHLISHVGMNMPTRISIS